MAAEIADIPCGRRTATRHFGDDVDDRLERKLHAAEAFRLVITEQARLVQQLLVLAQQHARVFAGLRALAQHRHAVARAAHRFLVADVRELAPRGLGEGADHRLRRLNKSR